MKTTPVLRPEGGPIPLETGSFTPSLAVPYVGAVERHLSGRKRAARVPLSAPSSCGQHAPRARQDRGHVAGSDRRTERNLEHAGMALGSQRGSHRDRKSRAVLSAVNALRSASTPPVRRGLRALTALARGTSWAIARWRIQWLRTISVRRPLTRDSLGRILIHRVCAARHTLRFAPSACGARFRSSPTGHDSSALQTSRTVVTPLRSA